MAGPISNSFDLAWRHTKLICFTPFNAEKWFSLGFVAWLANFGMSNFSSFTGGGNNNFDMKKMFNGAEPGDGQSAATAPSTTPQVDPAQIQAWLMNHLVPIILIALLVLVIVGVVGTLILWVRSRARVMFVENVVWQRDAIKEPWKRLGPLGNNLFWFEVYVVTMGLAFFAVGLAIAGVLAQPDLKAMQLGSMGKAAIGLMAFTSFVSMFGVMVTLSLQDNFVVPVMYRTGLMASPAWGVFWREFLSQNPLSFVLYYILAFCVMFLSGLALLVAGCLTCCIGFIVMGLPYIGAVALLPLSVFFRAWPIYFLEQLRPDWHFFPRPEDFQATTAAAPAPMPAPVITPPTDDFSSPKF